MYASTPLGAVTSASQVPVRLESLPADPDGQTRTTLEHMRAVVNASLRTPAVLETAAGIVQGIDGRDTVGQADALRRWLAMHLAFLPDPQGQETLRTPLYQLELIARGRRAQVDCDDAAILSAALGKAIGLEARFVALAFKGGPYRHVLTELRTTRGWRDMDVTSDAVRIRPTPSRQLRVLV